MLRTARRGGLLPAKEKKAEGRSAEASKASHTGSVGSSQPIDTASAARATATSSAPTWDTNIVPTDSNAGPYLTTPGGEVDWLAALEAQLGLGLTSASTASASASAPVAATDSVQGHVGGSFSAPGAWPAWDHDHPLFLNPDLGPGADPGDAVPFVGLEDFFVPPELDDLLAGLEARAGNGW